MRKTFALYFGVLIGIACAASGAENTLVSGFRNPGREARPRAFWNWLNGAVTHDGLARDLEEAKAKGLDGRASLFSRSKDEGPFPELFKNPPIEARPGAFWDWLNGNVDLTQMTRELEEMKAKGMSGAEIWDIGIIRQNPDETPIPAGPAFMGPESLKAINHAIDEATRLGLDLGLVSSSSWNAGGSWVEPADAMKGLYSSQTVMTGPARFSQKLPFPENNAPKGPGGLPVYSKEVAVLAFPQSGTNSIPDTAAIINLSTKMNADGLLTWDVPPGQWVIMRFLCTNTGQRLMVPSPNSNGLLIDHFSAQASENHFNYLVGEILKTRKSLDALKYMEVDSVEIDSGTDWTGNFVEEFRRRRGYDPIPYLPVLKGLGFADPLVAARFSYDYRKTVSDLWIDGHYRKAKEVLNRYGLKLVAEGGHGGYPRAEPLQACGVVDVPRGEFWNGSQFWVVKEAASAAHIYGLKMVDAESFTGWRSWQDGPLEYKRLADVAFCAGLNRMTFHTFAHNPPDAGLPGRVYHAGEHINVNTTWWPKAAPLFSYFSRCCYMLQQGLPVADVCYYYGDGAPNLVATRRIGPGPKRLDGATCAHCGRPNPAPADALGDGYDYDVVDSNVILNRMEVKGGRLVLPDGVGYALLALPNLETMPVAVLEKIEKLVRKGATVLGPKPLRSPSLTDYPRCDEQVRSVAEQLWGACDGSKIRERSYGKGWIIWDRNRTREVLQERGIGPDFGFRSATNGADLDYIHRRTADADIFFVSNKLMVEAEVECAFRVTGRQPTLWFADTGETQKCTAYDSNAKDTRLFLRLPPAGSVFVVFQGVVEKGHAAGAPVQEAVVLQTQDITGPWDVRFPPNLGAPASATFERLDSWTNNADEGIKYFSGTAVYIKEIEVPESMQVKGRRLILDLGQVRNVADVVLNGKKLGILWKPPFQADVTDSVHVGKNQLKVELTNLWANRVCGDAKLPKEKRITHVSQRLPVNGPLESGLLGPVQLRQTQAGTVATSQAVDLRPDVLNYEPFVWKSEPPADCPFEQSKELNGIRFLGVKSGYHYGDTWYPTWAENDILYSPWTDGKTKRLDGYTDWSQSWVDPVHITTGQGVIMGDDPLTLTAYSIGLDKSSPAAPYPGRYPCGSLIHNGVWYYGTYCLGPGDGVYYGKTRLNWPWIGPFVGFRHSKDYGHSWTPPPHTPEKPLFGETGMWGHPVKIGAPHFVDFGKNMEHSPDGKAYLVAHGADQKTATDNWRMWNDSWITGDQVYLLRVTPGITTINDPTAYEFYAGKDKDGKPVWTNDFEKIEPLLEWDNNMGCVTVTYNAPLKKYLMCVTDGGNTVSRMNTYLLESDRMTGEWKLVTYMKYFGEQAYFVNIPSKFISKDGKEAWLLYSGNFTGQVDGKELRANPPGSHYGMVFQKIQLLNEKQ